MKTILKKYLPFLYELLIRVRSFVLLFTHRQYTNSESYFVEYKERRRSRFEIFIDQCKHIIKYGSPNEYYFLYGLDIKGMHNAEDYVDYRKFMLRRDSLNRQADNPPIAILRNKFLFGSYTQTLGVATAHNIGVVEDGMIFLLDTYENISFEQYIKVTDVDTFIKTIDGECADGVFHLKINKGRITISGYEKTYSELLTLLQGKRYLLQEHLYQHESLNAIYAGSINTIRLETVYNKRVKSIEILPPLLRVGTGTNSVDNWAVGGLAIGIDLNTNSLCKYGFYKPSYGTKTATHPNSNIVFEGYHIPYIAEAIEQAKKLHSYLPEIHSIGWDIAITENGPCFIEGNDNWEISLVQICSHGLQREFDNYFN